MRVLLLGGTEGARELAALLAAQGIDATLSLASLSLAGLSLAGVTEAAHNPLPQRSGGFGGVAGLCAYIRAQSITHIIDATHPFAAQMSRHAAAASAKTGVRLLRLTRPDWALRPHWQAVASLADAAAALPKGARVFLTVGSQSLAAFQARDLWCLTRSIQPPATHLLGEVVLARPPFTLAGEVALMRQHAITHLVCKNAGGNQTAAKLDAADQLGIKVVIITRPVLAPAPEWATPETLLGALLQ
ncbi:MAG: cobalt-precorrin-6A reductase [Paracoccaceae bacterium]